MSPADLVRLRHIVEALNLAFGFVEGRQRRAIEVAGEAASRITPEARQELADVPWTSIVGMRNRLAHAYFDIDRDILWTTVTVAPPPIAERLRILIAQG